MQHNAGGSRHNAGGNGAHDPGKGQPGDILNAHSDERGKLLLTTAGTWTNSRLNAADLKLDNMRVSPGVQIYEHTMTGLVLRTLSEVPATVVATQYHKDSSGLVDLIIVDGYSGDGYRYGRIDSLTGYQLVRAGVSRWYLQTVQNNLVLTRKDGTANYAIPTGNLYASGYGAVLTYNGNFSGVTYLEAIENVNSSDFFTQDGTMYVRTQKGVFPVDDDVQCFNGAAFEGQPSDPPDWVKKMLANGGVWNSVNPPVPEAEGTWFPTDAKASVFDSLGECRSFSDTLTVYIDGRGKRVRVVEAK